MLLRRHRRSEARSSESPRTRHSGQDEAGHQRGICPWLLATGCGFCPRSPAWHLPLVVSHRCGFCPLSPAWHLPLVVSHRCGFCPRSPAWHLPLVVSHQRGFCPWYPCLPTSGCGICPRFANVITGCGFRPRSPAWAQPPGLPMNLYCLTGCWLRPAGLNK